VDGRPNGRNKTELRMSKEEKVLTSNAKVLCYASLPRMSLKLSFMLLYALRVFDFMS